MSVMYVPAEHLGTDLLCDDSDNMRTMCRGQQQQSTAVQNAPTDAPTDYALAGIPSAE
jgi:hypothetical protein